MSLHYFKGHGTENDFLCLPDPDGWLRLDAATVVALCDRHAGVGADGVIRLVRTAACDDPASVAARGDAEWFMDYRNSDGGLSEMCGNGIRVMARVLAEGEGIDVTQPLPIATRAGVKVLTFETDGRITVDMGAPRVFDETKVGVPGRTWGALHVSMGNPHAVAFVDDLADAGDLLNAPSVDETEFPDGVNVEFVVRRGAHHLAMRVHERGSGETRSCGTGACAVAVAAAVIDGELPGSAYTVDVPGGRLDVTWTESGTVLLTGPAVLVAEGQWLG